MRIKKAVAALLAFLCALVFAGCTGGGDTSSDVTYVNAKAEKFKEFRVEKFNLKFSTPDDWKEDNKDTELDWYCENGSVGMGIFGYYRSDFADSANVTDILSQQSKDNMERYRNIQKLEHTPEFASTDKNITAELYSAEYEGARYTSISAMLSLRKTTNFFG